MSNIINFKQILDNRKNYGEKIEEEEERLWLESLPFSSPDSADFKSCQYSCKIRREQNGQIQSTSCYGHDEENAFTAAGSCVIFIAFAGLQNKANAYPTACCVWTVRLSASCRHRHRFYLELGIDTNPPLA